MGTYICLKVKSTHSISTRTKPIAAGCCSLCTFHSIITDILVFKSYRYTCFNFSFTEKVLTSLFFLYLFSVCTWGSEGSLWEPLLFFHWGCWEQTQAIWPSSTCPCCQPSVCFVNICFLFLLMCVHLSVCSCVSACQCQARASELQEAVRGGF